MTARVTAFENLLQSLRRPWNFLDPDRDVSELFTATARELPLPQDIYFDDEEATPMVGFPVRRSPELAELEISLTEYVKGEERARVRMRRRESFDSDALEARWERYRQALEPMTENVVTSSYSRDLPAVFWLYHSRDLARLLSDTPRRVARHDVEIGRAQGGEIKYAVFFRYLDRVVEITHDVVDRIAAETDEAEDELFPGILTRMRDNVLILTEDHVGPDLVELLHYFDDHLHLDGRDLSYRLARLGDWVEHELGRDPELRSAAEHLLDRPDGDARTLISSPGFVTFLTAHERYDSGELLSSTQVEVWERLLVKLKEFELMHAVRRLMVPLEVGDDGLFVNQRGLDRTWGGPSRTRVSDTTRALDFATPSVVDPEVARFGMIYDVTDFSHTVSLLDRSSADEQDRSMRLMFRFQRRVNHIADSHRVTLEKYLGDGAFFSAREATRMLTMALLTQRTYRHVLREGFPFDRGLRIALNFGHYFLLPIDAGGRDTSERYEFFGQGVVELSRLTTGKTLQEIEELKNYLVKLGYSESAVHRFFAPLAAENVDLVDASEERRDFYAYIGRNGKLVNEGIVATDAFIRRLGDEREHAALHRAIYQNHPYVVMSVTDGEEPLRAGIRKLGVADLKGIEPVPVYEVVDGLGWDEDVLHELPSRELTSTLEREYGLRVTRV